MSRSSEIQDDDERRGRKSVRIMPLLNDTHLLSPVDISRPSADNEERIGLHIVRHASCRYKRMRFLSLFYALVLNCRFSGGNSKNIIQFADSDSAPVMSVPGKLGCYRIQGTVTVQRPVRPPLQMFIQCCL